MPNLPLTGTQVDQLIAFLRYTSEMDTEGWPPKPQVDGLQSPLARPFPGIATAAATAAPVGDVAARSEEHTSELQSLMRTSYAVFCLKKKKEADTSHKQTTTTH